MDTLQEFNLNADQRKAVEIVATTPGVTQKNVALTLKLSEDKVRAWFRNPSFVDACFDRFTELAGTKLITVMDAMFREAELGNVAAARLILEHHNKLNKTLHIKVESPFDRFMHSRNINDLSVEDAEIIGDSANITSILPPRNPDRTNPTKVIRNDKKRIANLENVSNSVIKERKRRNSAYHIRQRAKAVGLEPMPPGRHSEAARREWLNKLKRLEGQNNIK